MALSQDLVQQFAKTVTPKEEPKEATYNGTYRTIAGKDYVQIDGSEILTPVKTTVVAETDDRVKVLIKEHSATIIGNITSPSARSTDLNTLKDTVDEQGNTIQQMDNTIIQQGNSIIQLNNTVNQQGTTINQHDTIINQHSDSITSMNNTLLLHENAIELIDSDIIIQGGRIDALNDTVTSQGNTITALNNTVQLHDNSITQMSNTITQQGNIITQQGNQITQQGNQITSLNDTVQTQGNTILAHTNTLAAYGNRIAANESDISLQGASITILNSGFVIQDGVLTGLSSAIINSLKTSTLDVGYAKIDFANINMAAVEKLFTDSGIINDLVVESGKITGELVGVTLQGDLIKANTLVADKLVILGSDGLYYKLNNVGATIEAEQTEENSLNGQVIAAKSITASKIAVNDLVAFGATIGGFTIDNDSIHSNLKTSVDSSAEGLYLGSDGQIAFGNESNYIKYYKDTNENFILTARLDKLYLGSSTKTADQLIEDEIEITADGLKSTFRSSGGSNLLRNSVGYRDTNFWVTTGTIETESQPSISSSGSKFILHSGASMYQLYNTTPDEEYNITFLYKHTKSGTADTVSVVIDGQNGSRIEVLNTTAVSNEWTKVTLPQPYKATTTSPKIIISCGGSDDTFEITDLIVSRGTNDVWSPYMDEVYGGNHQLDGDGLRLFSNNKQSWTNSSEIIFKEKNPDTQTDEIVSILNKDRVLTDFGEFREGYKIDKLRTVLLDSNNIIEYIG